MSCRRLRRRLEALPAGRPVPEELRKHLGDCPSCAAARAQGESADSALAAAWPDIDPPEGLRWRVLTAARSQRAAAPPRPGWRVPKLAWAAAAALAAAVLWLSQPSSGPREVVVRLELPAGTRLVAEPSVTIVRGAE